MSVDDAVLLEQIEALRADLLDSLGDHDEAAALRAESVPATLSVIAGPLAMQQAQDHGLVPIGGSAYVSPQASEVLQHTGSLQVVDGD